MEIADGRGDVIIEGQNFYGLNFEEQWKQGTENSTGGEIVLQGVKEMGRW